MVAAADVAVIFVAFGVSHIDTDWIPPGATVVVVHNDDLLTDSAIDHPNVIHVRSGGNVGFGRGVNIGARSVSAARLVLCNPDVELREAHWRYLTDAAAHEVVTVSLVKADGSPTSVAGPYYTPVTLLLTAMRAGRVAPMGSAGRKVGARLLGRWGVQHADSITSVGGCWSLRERWVSGAVVSVDAARFKSIGGFDETFFLYFEDVDLSARLAAEFDDMVLRQGSVVGVHRVGDSSEGAPHSVQLTRLDSARRYADRQMGVAWIVVRLVLDAYWTVKRVSSR